MEIKKILVPTDFSEESMNALDVAAGIAKKTNAEISLLHVIDVPVVGHSDYVDIFGQGETSDDPELYKPYMHKLIEVTRDKLEGVKKKYQGVNITEHVEFDRLQRHIAEFVIKDETDLIVMGSKGVSGIEEILVGSNTERVIRLAKAPVLTVKQKIKPFELKNIVFASLFEKVHTKTIELIRYIQTTFGATLHFVKVITPNNFETTSDTHQLIQKFAQTHKFDNYTVNSYNFYSEEEGIRSFSNDLNADLIMMTTHGRTGIGHLLLGSIAEEVANHATRPIITFNQHFK
ncbi:universal stress protein [Rapidithrix thailandica]|uniref:Universal stress protein n=1 Tax=Rapidithrix thailandica TaxID=413964 RepID=A0AAW9SFI5_9BACT